MTFAPDDPGPVRIAVVAFGFMLSINVPLAFVAMVTMPFVYLTGVQMRKSMFPVSWLIQSRLADVATIVDENINGVRVVKSFAAEQQQLRSLAKAADRVQWGYVKDADLRARLTPAVQNLPQVGLALVLLVRRLHGHPRPPAASGPSWPSTPTCMLQAPFMMLGHDHHDGPAGRGVGRADLRDPRRAADHRRPARGRRPGRLPRATSTSTHVDFAYGGRTSPPVLDGLRPPPATRARPSPWSGGPASGKSTVARLLARFYDVTGGCGAGRRPRRAGPHPGQPAGPGRHRARRAVPLLGLDPRQHRLRATRRRPRRHRGGRPAPPAPTSSSGSCPTATTRWSASGATRSPAASASASPSPGPCSSTRRSWSSTTPPAPSTSRSSSRSTRRCACSWRAGRR